MVCTAVAQPSGRVGWLLRLVAVCLLIKWCESQCDPPAGQTVVMVDWNLTSAQDGRLAAGWYAGGDHGVGGNFMKSVMTFVSQACSCSSLCIYTDNTLPCTMFMVLILYHGHIIEFSLR